jgi:hypothetical protein
VVKVFYDAEVLAKRLRGLKWTGEIAETEEFFIYGSLRREGAG